MTFISQIKKFCVADGLFRVTTEFLQLLMLIIIANGAPVLARLLFRTKLNTAIDFGAVWIDNEPLFGASKTWRGVLAALFVTVIGALSFNLTILIGVQIAIFAVSGDLLSSFIKRRFSLPPSSKAPILDQVPESRPPVRSA